MSEVTRLVTIKVSEPMVTINLSTSHPDDQAELQIRLAERFPEAKMLVGGVGASLSIEIRETELEGFWNLVNRVADHHGFKLIH